MQKEGMYCYVYNGKNDIVPKIRTHRAFGLLVPFATSLILSEAKECPSSPYASASFASATPIPSLPASGCLGFQSASFGKLFINRDLLTPQPVGGRAYYVCLCQHLLL